MKELTTGSNLYVLDLDFSYDSRKPYDNSQRYFFHK